MAKLAMLLIAATLILSLVLGLSAKHTVSQVLTTHLTIQR